MLANALVPNMPVPFPASVEEERANPYTNSRLAGSRAKSTKDTALIDAFSTLADVILTVLLPQKTNDVEYVTPNPKVRWALHQRLGNAPSATAKGAKTPMQTSDWFSAATESMNAGGSRKDEKDEEGDVDMDKMKKETEDKEEGPLTRMQRERAFGKSVFTSKFMLRHSNSRKAMQTRSPCRHPLAITVVALKLRRRRWMRSCLSTQVVPTGDRSGKNVDSKSREMHMSAEQVRLLSIQYLAFDLTSISSKVTYPRCYSTFTPSFAPTHDSFTASNGFGYYPTWDAGIGKANVQSWMNSMWSSRYGAELEIPSDNDTAGQIQDFRPRATKDDIEDLLKNLAQDESTLEIDPALVDAVDQTQDEMRELQRKLDQNAVWVKQLQEFQEIRLHRGQRKPLEEEDRIGESEQEIPFMRPDDVSSAL